MHRTNSWLTLVAAVLVALYAAYLRTGEAPRTPSAVATTADPAAEGDAIPVVVSVPARPERPLKSYAQPQAAAPIPADSVLLIREIQRELRRVGCYERGINGIWTTSSRMAAQMFTERVNARLPIDTPDAALLSLLQNQPQPVCGRPCTPEQAHDAASHCIPEPSTSPSAKVTDAADKPMTPTAPPDPQSAYERHPADAEAQTVQRSATPTSKKGAIYWRSLVRSIDRALGLY
jgi:hypothetical protein